MKAEAPVTGMLFFNIYEHDLSASFIIRESVIEWVSGETGMAGVSPLDTPGAIGDILTKTIPSALRQFLALADRFPEVQQKLSAL